MRRRGDTFPSVEADHSRRTNYQSGCYGTKATGRRATVDEKRRRREEDVVGQQTQQRRQSRSSHGRGDLQPPVGPPDARTSAHEHIVSLAQHAQSISEGQAVARHTGTETIGRQSQETVRVGALDGQGRPIFRWKSVQATAVLVAGMFFCLVRFDFTARAEIDALNRKLEYY